MSEKIPLKVYDSKTGVIKTVKRIPIVKNPLYKKLGRNDSCPCGSGIKYKKCCLNEIEGRRDEV